MLQIMFTFDNAHWLRLLTCVCIVRVSVQNYAGSIQRAHLGDRMSPGPRHSPDERVCLSRGVTRPFPQVSPKDWFALNGNNLSQGIVYLDVEVPACFVLSLEWPLEATRYHSSCSPPCGSAVTSCFSWLCGRFLGLKSLWNVVEEAKKQSLDFCFSPFILLLSTYQLSTFQGNHICFFPLRK